MASRAKRKNRDRARREAMAAPVGPPAIPPGLPGGPPYAPPARVTDAVAPRRVGLYLPERLSRAAQDENPISQYIRAKQCLKWRIPCKEWRNR